MLNNAAPKRPSAPSPWRGSHGLASLRLVSVLAVALVVALALMIPAMSGPDPRGPAPSSQQTEPDDAALAAAFQDQQSGIRVLGRGTVIRVLPDDTQGDRHQRFIIELQSGQTLLIAHNIDIALRVPSLAQGALVAFSGVYEWNTEGGVVHWTHHDPDGRHAPGWLDVDGLRYQ